MTPRLGSLCTGYSGLEQGLAQLFDFDLAWVSDIDKGANKILAARHPDVPNLGDFTELNWRDVEPVDILTAGFPCQDVSHAGKRAGLKPGTRTGIWSNIADAIDVLRPALCVFENVRGLLSAEAHSDVEPCPWCVGDAADGSLRALGAVLGDLAERGYDCRVTGVRAADVGAPHGRFRVFVVATDTRGEAERLWTGLRQSQPRGVRRGRPDHNGAPAHVLPTGALLPTPRATDGTKGGPNQRGSSGDLMLPSAVMELLPTPRATRGGSATETTALLPTPTTQPTTGNGHARNLGAETRLLPTPLSADAGPRGGTTGFGMRDWSREHATDFGDYESAVRRWETVTRPAPAPTELSAKGTPRLSPRFVEWMMGLPAGWVTDVPDLTRNEQLKALGNGVVPQQAAAAVGWLLDTKAVAA
jgi:DNA (cytosine-5)-methyltransferase 1